MMNSDVDFDGDYILIFWLWKYNREYRMPPQWWWLMEKSRRQLWQREPPRWSVIMTKRTAADNYAPIVIIFSLSSPPSYPLKSRLMVMLMTPRMMICLIYMGDKICCCIFPGTFCKQILKKIIWNWSKWDFTFFQETVTNWGRHSLRFW